MDIVETEGYATGAVAAVLVYGVHVTAPLLYGVVNIVRWLVASRRARLADAQSVESIDDGRLTAGEAVVCGVVELAPGYDAAFRVEIDQVGEEGKDKHGFHHSWRETARRVRAVPFILRELRGARVRVEPNETAMLVDGLDRVERHGKRHRTKFAELTAGEEIYASGELVPVASGGAYRGGDETFLLRPPARGRMLLSTEPLGARFRRTATHARYGLTACFVFFVAFALLDLGYHLRMFEGERETGVVEVAKARVGKKSRSCNVTVRLTDGGRLESSVAYETCPRLAPGSEVPVFVVRGARGFEHIGRTAGISAVVLVFGSLAFAALVIFHRAGAQPWYERAVVERARGPLA